MAGRRALQFPRGNYWSQTGAEDVLVFCDALHFHFVRELVWVDSRRRNDWLGSSRSNHWPLSHRPPASARRQCRFEHDHGHGCDLLLLWLIWAIQANGIGGFLLHLFGPKGETSGILKLVMVVIFFLVGWL